MTEPVQYTRFTLAKLGRSGAGVKAGGRQPLRLDQWAPVLEKGCGRSWAGSGGRAALGRGGLGLSGREEAGSGRGAYGHCR